MAYARAMQRLTISLDSELADAFDALARERGYASRSEAMRDLVREAVDARDLAANPEGQCIAALSFVYDHEVRDLPSRLTAVGHAHHDLVIATTHVHLDHHDCMETMMLRGSVAGVSGFADAIRAERGVRFAALNMIGVEPDAAHDAGHHHRHLHLSPRRA